MSLDEFLKSKLGNALGHIGIGFVLMLIVGTVTDDVWKGHLFQAGYWYGREVTEYMRKANLDPFSPRDVLTGMNPLAWRGELGKDGRRDLFFPFLINGILAWIWTFR